MESYVNGKLYTKMSLKDADAYDKNQTVGDKAKYAGMQAFRDPAYLILNGGAVGDTSVNLDKSKLPFDTQVDYVRVYQKPGEGSIYQQAVITTGSLPSATKGTEYDSPIKTTGLPENENKIEISKGSLPDGLRLDSSSGVISGVPTAAGKYTFTVIATNDQIIDMSNSRTYTINVADNHKPDSTDKTDEGAGIVNKNTNSNDGAKTKKYPGVPNTSVKLGSFGFLIAVAILVLILLKWKRPTKSR